MTARTLWGWDYSAYSDALGIDEWVGFPLTDDGALSADDLASLAAWFAGSWETDTHALGLGTLHPIACTLYHDNGRVVELHRGHGGEESDIDLYPMLSIREQLTMADAVERFLVETR